MKPTLCIFGALAEPELCTFGAHTKVWRFARFSAAVERSGTEAENLGGSLLAGCLLALHRLLQAVALAREYHDVRMMHQAVYQSRRQAVVAKHRVPP